MIDNKDVTFKYFGATVIAESKYLKIIIEFPKMGVNNLQNGYNCK